MNIFNFAKQEELKKLESLVLELKQSLKETNEQIEKLQEKNRELEKLIQEQKAIQTEPYKEKPKRGRPFKKSENINENNISKTTSGKRRGRPKKEVPDAAVMGLDFPEEEVKEKKVRKYKKKPSPKISVEKIESYSDVLGNK